MYCIVYIESIHPSHVPESPTLGFNLLNFLSASIKKVTSLRTSKGTCMEAMLGQSKAMEMNRTLQASTRPAFCQYYNCRVLARPLVDGFAPFG